MRKNLFFPNWFIFSKLENKNSGYLLFYFDSIFVWQIGRWYNLKEIIYIFKKVLPIETKRYFCLLITYRSENRFFFFSRFPFDPKCQEPNVQHTWSNAFHGFPCLWNQRFCSNNCSVLRWKVCARPLFFYG